MSKNILVIWTKNRLKTDMALEVATKIGNHLDNEFKVLVLDKNVEKMEFFDTGEAGSQEVELDKAIDKIEKENE